MSLLAGAQVNDERIKRHWPWLGAAGSFVLAALLGAVIAFGVERDRRTASEIQAHQLASAAAHDIGERLDRALSAANALTAVLRQGDGRIDDFKTLAKELIGLFGGISALQLAPGGIITQVEPLAGNERVIGFSPVSDPVQGPEARLVIESRKLGLTGPFELRQGGIGVVGRTPVFLKDGTGHETFWGLIQVLIRVPDLLVATRLNGIEEAGYRYELWRIPPGSEVRQVFSRSTDQALASPVEVRIPVPNGEWVLSVAPDDGWYARDDLLLDVLAVLLAALLVAVVTYLTLRQPVLLRREVALRTRELQASEEKYRELVDFAASILLKCDREGRVLYLNEFGLQFFGYREDEIVGQSVIGTLIPAGEVDQGTLDEKMEEFFSRPELHAATLSEHVKRSGERVWVAWRNRVMRDADGVPSGMFCVGIDVSERRRIEDEVRAANERYERLNAELEQRVAERTQQLQKEVSERQAAEKLLSFNERMATLGYLATGIVEQLAPVMDGILAGERSPAQLTGVAEMLRALQHMADDQTREARRRFDLAAMLGEIGLVMAPLFAGQAARLELEAETGLVMDSDPGALGQVVVNLVENALLHAFVKRTAGRVSIAARAASAGRVTIAVSDDGDGIEAAILPHIFEPFYSSGTERGGRGIGLAIVRQLVEERLGGELAVSSAVGRGSCFTLNLPLLAPARD